MKRLIPRSSLSLPAALRVGTLVALSALAALLPAAPSTAEVVATPGGIRFSHSAPNAGTVQVAGSFNSWTGEAMDREADGTWSRVVRLGPGLHEYKFVVDGQWISDPDNAVTLGDYGNSAFTLGSDGTMGAMEEVSNTPYNARFFITGRTIALYDSYKNDEADGRFELRRPSYDTDLNFAVRVNDVMDARILTNINNEAENVESFRTRLNFDRGMMHFTTEDLEGWAWDNDAVDNWDDPLALVGNVGIYDHAFGYDTQGAMLARGYRGAHAQLLYADNFVAGGQDRPALESFFTTEVKAGGLTFAQLGSDSLFSYVAAPGRDYRFVETSGDEDVLATRAMYGLGNVAFGLSGRFDRGYNPGVIGDFQDVAADTALVETGSRAVADTAAVPGFSSTRRTFDGTERWFGVGGDIRWDDLADQVDVQFEVLYGKAQIAFRNGEEQRVFLGTGTDTSGAPIAIFGPLTDVKVLEGGTLDLDESLRLHLGLSGLPEFLGANFGTSVGLERHDLTPLATGQDEDITNEIWRWDAFVERPSRVAGRAVLPSLGMEFHYFDYDPSSPWEYQLWFDYRNFWLENGEHDVKFERLTLLGGADALILRPALEVEILASPRVTFRYDGTVAGPGFGREPSYVETLLQGTWQIRPRWRFHTDLRFAKYNSRPLDLNDSYNETFLEVAYEVAEGIELALSYGVDPWAIDGPVNEYGYIGRDLYLFARDATGAVARTNYVGLAELIPEAESALANERVIQIEAVVRF